MSGCIVLSVASVMLMNGANGLSFITRTLPPAPARHTRILQPSRPLRPSFRYDTCLHKTSASQVLGHDHEFDEQADEQAWLSDAELVRRATQLPGGEALTNRDATTLQKFKSADADPPQKKSVYTDEEEELILAMGGKAYQSDSQTSPIDHQEREEGYLGDCTLTEIAQDYSIPLCYLADTLTTWGVPPPLDTTHTPLGDMITGEQAFALLEALHTLDIAELQDAYSNDSLEDVCDMEDIDLKKAFEMCMQEGWNLPFGTKTCLKLDQEEELIRVLGGFDSLQQDFQDEFQQDYDENKENEEEDGLEMDTTTPGQLAGSGILNNLK